MAMKSVVVDEVHICPECPMVVPAGRKYCALCTAMADLVARERYRNQPKLDWWLIGVVLGGILLLGVVAWLLGGGM